ncbi:MAG: MFS transporter [Actinomycetota bacterium]|nr:MFS transporter [Actinomycetota bacterium]
MTLAPVRADAASSVRSKGAWAIVGATFIMLAFNTGFGFYALGAFNRGYIDSVGMSVSATSAGATIFLLAGGISGLFVARLMKQVGIRWLLLAGTVGSAACLAMLGAVTQVWQMWAVFLIFGLVSAGFSMIPTSAMVLGEFAEESVARPMAVMATGFSVGGAVLAPIITAVVLSFGIATAGIAMALTLLVVMIPLSIAATGHEPRIGSATYVATKVEKATGKEQHGSGGWPFFGVCIAYSLLLITQVSVVIHLLTLATERGIGGAAITLSLFASMAFVGRLIGLAIMPRFTLRSLSVVMAGLQVLALCILAFSADLMWLAIGAALMGLPSGNNQVFMPLWLLNLFGAARYPTVFARSNLITGFSVALGPLYVGVVHESAGNYQLPFLVLAASAVCAGVIIATLPHKGATDHEMS